MPHSLICPHQPWICMPRENKFANTHIPYIAGTYLKHNFFLCYFLQVIPKKEAPHSPNYHFNCFLFVFLFCSFLFASVPIIFIAPSSIHLSILSSYPRSLTSQSLFYHCCVREKRTGERRRRKRGRWPAFYLSVFLLVCLIVVQVWPLWKWLSSYSSQTYISMRRLKTNNYWDHVNVVF